MFDDNNYSREISAAYFAEEEEMKLGIHPTQVKERIISCLDKAGVEYKEITFLDWNCKGPRVVVSLDNTEYGVFNYTKNEFEWYI